jgi:hypothetical protein
LCKFPKPLYIQKSKFYSEIILLRFQPIRPSLAHAGPLRPAGRCARARPTRPEQPWRICQKVPLLRVCAVRQRRFLSLTLLPSGPHPLVPPPSSHRPTQIPSPTRLAGSDRPRLPASIIETPIKAPYSPALIPPLESPLTPPRPSMASVVNHRSLLTGISTPSSLGPL